MADQPEGAIDVVIVNWNSAGHLKHCLDALAVDSERTFIRSVTVVDNLSTDGSVDIETPPTLRVRIDRAGENLGFARGCNRGARPGEAEILLFLNPDTRIRPGALEAGVTALRTRPDLGIVGLRLVDATDTSQGSCSNFPSPLAFFLRAFALDRLPWLSRFRAFMPESDCAGSRIVDQVMGACWFMPRPLFRELGGFDERFFMYYEDTDLALRSKRAGRGSWFEISGKAEHTGGGSSSAIPERRLFYFLRSRLTFARKHFSRSNYLAVLLTTLTIEPWTRLILTGWRQGFGGLRAVVAGYRLLWCSLVNEN